MCLSLCCQWLRLKVFYICLSGAISGCFGRWFIYACLELSVVALEGGLYIYACLKLSVVALEGGLYVCVGGCFGRWFICLSGVVSDCGGGRWFSTKHLCPCITNEGS